LPPSAGAEAARGAVGHHRGVQLRPARPDEADDIASVWLRSRAASVPAIPPPVHTDDDVRRFFAETVLPMREVWVADDAGTVVALLVLDGDWIDQLYVEPGRTGQGIGAALLGVAKARHPHRLRLWTFAANTGARHFYERHDFVAVARTDSDNEEGAPDVGYEWDPDGTQLPWKP
jgi:GNAT superfamily N-acetyltransferase